MIKDTLCSLRDEAYANFIRKLIPTVNPQTIIGVRTPQLRRLAKQLIKEGKENEPLAQLPHTYLEENLLCALIINEIKDLDALKQTLDRFLPYVDNWAVCDVLSPKAFQKQPTPALDYSLQNIHSAHPYTCRFSVKLLMIHFLDERFQADILLLPLQALNLHSNHYYIQMMLAWFYATALAKQWNDTVAFLEKGLLPNIVQKMTLQKARDSLRLSKEQKEYLKRFKP